LSWIYMPNYKSEHYHFDIKGFIIFSFACILLAVSVELMGESSFLTYTIIGLSLAILFLVWYLKYAKRHDDALFPVSLFKIRIFGNIATRLGISSLPLLIPLMIQVVYQESATTAGWMVAPLAIAALLNKPLMMPIINKLGYKKILLSNTIIIGCMIMLFAIP